MMRATPPPSAADAAPRGWLARWRTARAQAAASRSGATTPRLERLEPRRLHAADPLLGGLPAAQVLLLSADDAAPTTAPTTAPSSAPAEAVLRHHGLVVIDAGVADAAALIEQLRAAAPAETELHFVQLTQDGGGLASALAQIGEALAAGDAPWDALHLVSHGQAGALLLGGQTLDSAALAHDAPWIAGWRTHLAPDADLLLYGCEVGRGAEGLAFVEALAAATGADVAASVDATGSALQGGNWALEARFGHFETAALGAQAWQSLLGMTASGTNVTVNSSIPGVQYRPDIAVDANGNVVVVWADLSSTSGDIQFQRFLADGSSAGTQTLVNTDYTTGAQDGPAVAMDAAGNFVVTWVSTGEDGDGDTVMARRFDAAGNALGAAFRVNTLTTGHQQSPDVAMAADGRFVIVFVDANVNGGDVLAQRYAADGTAVGGNFVVPNVVTGAQSLPSVGIDGNGNFAVAWTSDIGGGNTDVLARRFDWAGNALGMLNVQIDSTGNQSAPDVAMNDAGRIVVAYQDSANGGDVRFTLFNSVGTPVRTGITAHSASASAESQASVAMRSDGSFVVGWTSTATGNADVHAAQFDKTGTADGTQVRLNSYLTNSQSGAALTMRGGQAVAVWQGWGATDTNDQSIYLQRYAVPIYAGISTSRSGGLVVVEGGATADLTVVLDAAPTANVTVPITINGSSQVSASTASLTFTPTNWSTPQTVTFTAIDDTVVDGSSPFDIVVGASSSSDSAYNGITLPYLTGNWADDNDTVNTLVVDTVSDVVDGTTTSISALLANKGADGRISLREAILAANQTANASGGADRIVFSIAGTGKHTIVVSGSKMEELTDAVVIDGTTDDSFAANGNRPAIVIDANNAGGVLGAGLYVNTGGSGSTLRGLEIRGSNAFGIAIIDNVTHVTVTNNVITANAGGGIQVQGDNALITGNVIGGNGNAGILLGLFSNTATVQGNLVGTQADGATAWANTGIGVDVGGVGHTIGGTGAGQGNTVAWNGGKGIVVRSSNSPLLGNAVFSNGGLGIDLGDNGVTLNDGGDADTGANGLQNFPVLTSARTDGAGQLTVGGSLNSTSGSTFRIEYFASPSVDASGHGEGARLLGFSLVTTNASGDATIHATLAATVAAGEFITATATKTDASGNNPTATSEFSKAVGAISNVQATVAVDTVSDVNDGDTSSIGALLAQRGADGVISLREAILAANNTANGTQPDRIQFAIPGTGVHTITLDSWLPAITQAVVIDGSSDDSWAANGHRPAIVVDGNDQIGAGFGFNASAAGSTLRGLVIRNFGGAGVFIASGANDITLSDNYIGAYTAAGTWAGATTGNGSTGVFIDGNGAILSGNLIGGNGSMGIQFGNNTSGAVLTGNFIGVGVDGVTAIGNTSTGIHVDGTGHRIGGTAPGEGNIVAWNADGGITLASPTGSTALLGNRIFGNDGLGIDLRGDGVTLNDAGDSDTGPNALQNFPVIASASSSGTQVTIHGSLDTQASGHFRVEFFASTSADATGYGEGARWLGFVDVDTDAGGHASFITTLDAAVAVGEVITATATVTDAGHTSFTATSEFSQARSVTGGGPVNTLPGPVTLAEDSGAMSIAGVSVASSGSTLASVRLDVGHGVVAVSLASGASITAGSNSTAGFTLGGTQSQINAALATLVYAPAADFHGADALTLLSTDASGDTDSDSLAITITPVNDAPTITSPATAAVPERQTGVMTLTAGDADGDAITWSLTGGADQAFFGLDPATGLLRFLAAPDFEVRADADGDNVYVVQVGASDGSATTTRTLSITVTDVNEAPVLNAGGRSLTLAEDSQAPLGAVGTLVSSLMGSWSDPDAGAQPGLALLGVDASHGDWFYSLDDGATWQAVGSVSPSSALLLAADAGTRLALQPTPDFHGSFAGLTVRAWDRSSGSAGDKVDATAGGGTSSFSSASDDIQVTVVNTGDVALTVVGGSTTMQEAGGSVTFSVALDAAPTADVVVTFDMGSAAGRAAASASSLTFTAADWATPKTLTVAALDNLLDDEDRSWTVVTTVSSADPQYGGRALADPVLTVQDDDLFNTVVVDTTSMQIDGDTSSIAALLASRGADGQISLREAIAAANHTPTRLGGLPDRIVFDIPQPLVGGFHTLAVGAFDAVPEITDTVVIDGFSEPDAGTLPVIRIDGSGHAGHGLNLGAGAAGSVIRGLDIQNFGASAVWVQAGATDVTLQGNVLHHDAAGGTFGVRTEAARTRIGGPGAGEGNTFFGLKSAAVAVDPGATGTVIQHNVFGATPTGQVAAATANAEAAIRVSASDVQVLGNVIINTLTARDGVGPVGLLLQGANTVVQGNRIGLLADGTAAPNGDDAQALSSGIHLDTGATGVLIGGTGAGQGNRIENTRGAGIAAADDATIQFSAIGNTFGGQSRLAIDLGHDGSTANDAGDLDSGPNGRLNTPVLTGVNVDAGGTQVIGTWSGQPNQTLRLEFGHGPSGDDEIDTLLGSFTVTTDASGLAQFDHVFAGTPIAAGRIVRATATQEPVAGQFGATSEFSAGLAANASAAGVTVTLLTPAVTSEAGASARFSVALARAPTADVTVTLQVSLPREATLSTAQLTFTRANWAEAQSVTVTGRDDLLADGDRNFSVVLGPATSLDPAWQGIDSADVALTNLDDDQFNTIVVTTTDDTADGDTRSLSALTDDPGADGVSLREALMAANATPNGPGGPDRIVFRIDAPRVGGEHVIDVATALPIVTDAVVVDASTDPDATAGPVVVLRNAAAVTDGLQLGADADGSTVRGLIIRGFDGSGLRVDAGSSNHLITGNWLGALHADGSVAAGEANGQAGLVVHGDHVTIEHNVLSGNTTFGLLISQPSAVGNGVRGNFIGTAPDGLTAVGNGASGLVLDLGASGTTVGGTAPGDGNVIAHNFGAGIASVDSAANFTALGNQIHGNRGLAIDLDNDGVDPQDADDADTGSNGKLNAPTLAMAWRSGGGADTGIAGHYQGQANTTLRLEFFASAGADPSGHGPAQRLLGSTTVTTDASGRADFSRTLAGAATAIGEVVSATATHDLGGSTFGSTSELAANVAVVEATPAVALPGGANVAEDGTLGLAGVSVTDVSGDLNRVQLDVTQGVVQVDVGGGALIAGNGSATLTIDGNQAQINAALATLRYTPGADWHGTDTLTVLAHDAEGLSGSGSTAITVTPVNDAPVLTALAPQFATVEDATTPAGAVGFRVADLLAGVSDVDAGAQRGVALIGSDEGHGRWFFSTDGGQAWQAVGSLGANAALLLQADADTRLQFLPDPDVNGVHMDLLTFAAWDGSSGSPGTVADASARGGSSAFSAATDRVGMFIQPIGDVRVSGGPILTTEGGGQATFTVVLDQQPTADVVVPLGVSNPREATLSATSLTFTPTNWNVAQTVTVTGLDDHAIDGAMPYSVVIGAATSADAAFDGHDAADLPASNADDDDRNTVVVDTASDVADGDTSSYAALLANRGADGRISLREAILAANATPNGPGGIDRILFGIADAPVDGLHTISPLTALPTVQDAVLIDGTSQPGFAGTPVIALDGNGLAAKGLQLGASADGSTVRGLLIRHFQGSGIEIATGSDGNTLAGNWLGPYDAAGHSLGAGEWLSGPALSVAGSHNQIGLPGEGNWIGGNRSHGIALNGSFNVVQGNVIGLARDGAAMGQGGHGIFIFSGSDMLIGGTGVGEGNVVQHAASGIVPFASASPPQRIAMLGNLLSGHGGMGIDLGADGADANDPGDADAGPNGRLNAPRLDLAEQTTAGTRLVGHYDGLAGRSLRIEVFSAATPHGSGHGDAAVLLGSFQIRTDASGHAAFDVLLPTRATLGHVVSATATLDEGSGQWGDTSELSSARAVVDPAPLLTPPAPIVLAEDSRIAAPGGVVVDAGGNLSTLRLTVARGLLDVDLAGGATVLAGANDSNDLTLGGSEAQINAALASLRYRGAPDSHGTDTLTLQAADTFGHVTEATTAIHVTPVNDAPRIATPATEPLPVLENTRHVATLAAGDVDGDALHWSIVGGADAAHFTLDPVTGALSMRVTPDFEQPQDADGDGIHDIIVAVDDGQGGQATQALRVAVQDAPEAPTWAAPEPAGLALPENTTVVPIALRAFDPDAGEQAALRWDIVGGADAAAFEIDPRSGALALRHPADFEAPSDADRDGRYDLIVEVADPTGRSARRAVQLVVTDVNEAPTLHLPTLLELPRAGEPGRALLQAEATDPDRGDAPRFALVDDARGRFRIDPVTGRIEATQPALLDAELQRRFDLVVEVTDAGGLAHRAALTITLAAPAVAPPAAAPWHPPSPLPITATPATPVVAVDAPATGHATGDAAADVPPASPTDAAAAIRPSAGSPIPVRSDVQQVATTRAPNGPRSAAMRLPLAQGSIAGTASGWQPSDFAMAIQPLEVTSVAFTPGALATRGLGLRAGDLDVLADVHAQGGDSEPAAAPNALDWLVQPGTAVGLAGTAGMLWALTRSGGLIGALLMNVPAWRHIDLLPVVAHAGERRDDDGEEHLDAVFDPAAPPTDPDAPSPARRAAEDAIRAAARAAADTLRDTRAAAAPPSMTPTADLPR